MSIEDMINSIRFTIVINLLLSQFKLIEASMMRSLAKTKVIKSICSGEWHSCAVFDNHRAKCWGLKSSWGLTAYSADSFGDDVLELGERLPFVDIGIEAMIDSISCGGSHVCMKLDIGYMKCLGSNINGQTGIGVTNDVVGVVSGHQSDKLPVVVLGSRVKVINMALGNQHTCALVTRNQVKCFGQNYHGQLGIGNASEVGRSLITLGNDLPFVDFGTGAEISSVHSGASANHNCAIFSEPIGFRQRVKCWGHNSAYQLGYGDQNNRGDEPGEMGNDLQFVDLGIESRVKQLALGCAYTCALLIDNSLKCFGAEFFQISKLDLVDPVYITGEGIPVIQIDSGKKIKLITSGYQHICIVYDDQVTMKCIGQNESGQLGQGDKLRIDSSRTNILSSLPAIDLGTGSLKTNLVISGNSHNCVTFADSSVKCFGSNLYGQLATGSKMNAGDQPHTMGMNLHFSSLQSSNEIQVEQIPSYEPATEAASGKPVITILLKIHLSQSNSFPDAVMLSFLLSIASIFALLILRMWRSKDSEEASTKELEKGKEESCLIDCLSDSD